MTVEHLAISAIAIVIAAALGLVLGIVISEYRRSAGFVTGLVNFIYTIPSISLLGFLIPLSGIGNTTAIIALTVYALLPMVRNTHSGLEAIDPDVIEAAVGMGSTRWQLLRRIKLPLAFPAILAGLRNMVVMTIALAGIASFIGAGGLGVAIYRGITTNNSAMVLAGSLLIALLALFFDFLLGGLEKSVVVKRRSGGTVRSWRLPVLLLCILAIAAGTRYFLTAKGTAETVHIATKPMTEQYILGDMLSLLIEQDTGLRVEMTQGVGGGTGNIHPALLKGEFDLYPEYTGTAWAYVLKKEGIPDEAELRADLVREYRDQFDLDWIGMYGFNNTYGIAVRREVAERHNLATYTDLAAVAPDLVFGAEYDFFERDDGYDALCETYGYQFKRTRDLDIGLKYQAIGAGEIDAMVVFTTDGQLSVADITVLQDDRNFFPNYYCGNVVRRDALARLPGLREVLTKMSGAVNEAEMAALNYQVEGEKRDSREVAREFLRRKNLIR